MSADDDILPSPDDDVLSEEELKTYQIKITTVYTNSFNFVRL